MVKMFTRFTSIVWLLHICFSPLSAQAGTVALDVGHSLARPGAISARGRTEFSFNRQLALVVKEVLQTRGFHPQLIGEHGDMNTLRARTDAASEAEFFLSLHHDAVQPRYLEYWEVDSKRQHYSDRFSGFSLFVSRANPEPTKSLACASAIGNAFRRAGFKPSAHHAEPIAGENRPFADATNGIHYFDDLVVLKTTRVPAVLLEAGIIVNRMEELLLQEPMTHEKIAVAIADGLQQCLKGP
jgi:N-acetylmuramoyl-L-alanine amidase